MHKVTVVACSILLATSTHLVGCRDLSVSVVPVASVEVLPPTVSLEAGQSMGLQAIPADGDGNPLQGRVVEWNIGDPSKALVSSSGMVHALASGETVVEARSEGVVGSAEIRIIRPEPEPPPPEEDGDEDDDDEDDGDDEDEKGDDEKGDDEKDEENDDGDSDDGNPDDRNGDSDDDGGGRDNGKGDDDEDGRRDRDDDDGGEEDEEEGDDDEKDEEDDDDDERGGRGRDITPLATSRPPNPPGSAGLRARSRSVPPGR